MSHPLGTFVIAEIGINHDGDFSKAQLLIQQAAASGCQGIKFQYRNIKNAYAKASNEIGDEIIHTQITKTYLDPTQIRTLSEYARNLGLESGISFFTIEDTNDFPNYKEDFDFYKIPSAELMNLELIKILLDTGKKTYISTGMHSEEEIESIFSEIKSSPNWIPLHCVSNYPVSMHNATLGYIPFLRNKWKREIGYSSHDENWETVLIAMGIGATVIERHITLDRNGQGLDHSSSSTSAEFKKINYFAKEISTLMLGNGPRVPNQGELLNKQNLGRSYYAKKNMKAGVPLDLRDFEYRNPQVGLAPVAVKKHIGSPLISDIVKDAVLSSRHLIKSARKLKEFEIESARKFNISIPVRLADYQLISEQIPIGAYEFHLSYKEVESELLEFKFNTSDKFSVHLPDYIDSTNLIDPFSSDHDVRKKSLDCINKVVEFSTALSEMTGHNVPIVASLAGINIGKDKFYPQVRALFDEVGNSNSSLTLQWLPPFAWYFGGSIKLTNVNSVEDIKWLKEYNLPLTLDSSHLLLGKNAFGFDPVRIVDDLEPLIKHWHISDAQGLDAEGLQFGDGDPENMNLISNILNQQGLKVIEVWQGHFDDFSGFKEAIHRLNTAKSDNK